MSLQYLKIKGEELAQGVRCVEIVQHNINCYRGGEMYVCVCVCHQLSTFRRAGGAHCCVSFYFFILVTYFIKTNGSGQDLWLCY